jgi:hypothetical protein
MVPQSASGSFFRCVVPSPSPSPSPCPSPSPLPLPMCWVGGSVRVRVSARDSGRGSDSELHHSRASRARAPPTMVAWASSPRKDHSPSEQRPHDGQDARRTMGCSARRSGRTTERVTSALRQGDISTRRLGRYDMGGVRPASATATAPGPGTVSGNRPRPPVTGSVTDEVVPEHHEAKPASRRSRLRSRRHRRGRGRPRYTRSPPW